MEALLVIAVSLLGQELPPGGTQPGELPQALIPEPSTSCNCHFDFDPAHKNEPGESYMPTAMALSARSPVFLAAFRIAYQDRPEVSALCIRCHMPRGWLAGRSTPGDGSALEAEDFQGITCDVCHRMVPADPPVLSDGQYTISRSSSKRGPRDYLPSSHSVSQDPYLSTPEACGVCHSLFNPLETHKDPDGRELGINYFEQRTYEEWKGSDYSAANGKTCIDCHMKKVEGFSSGFDQTNLYPDLRVHNIVGGNLFVPQAVAMLYPNLQIGPRLAQLEEWINEQLRAAATLELNAPALIEAGQTLDLSVKVTNETGHKLPTGYPEGRRAYLEVSLEINGRAPTVISGRWVPETGDLDFDDEQLRSYDTGHAVLGQGRSPHLILANQTLWDTRIPPKGYRPMYPDMLPYGRDYGAAAPYRNYDETSYAVDLPTDVLASTGAKVVVRLMYQSLYGFYYDFLMANLPADSEEAQNLQRVYEALGKAPPREMARQELAFTIMPASAPPDAGMADSGVTVIRRDAGVEDPVDDGCRCVASRSSDAAHGAAVVLGSLLMLRRRRVSRRGAEA